MAKLTVGRLGHETPGGSFHVGLIYCPAGLLKVIILIIRAVYLECTSRFTKNRFWFKYTLLLFKYGKKNNS